MKRLLLIGGGHAHVEVLRRFALQPVPGTRMTVISPHRHTPYSGMLPGLIAGHYRFDDAHIDLLPLAGRAGAELVLDRVVRLDAEARTAFGSNCVDLEFDVCSIDIGSTPRADVPGAPEYAVGVKPVDRFLERWSGEIEKARTAAPDDIAVVGGGAGGLEVLLAMQHAAGSAIPDAGRRPRFHLVTDTPVILPSHSPAVRRKFQRVLEARAVHVHLDARVTRVTPELLEFADGRTQRADFVVWATTAAAAPWIRESGLGVDGNGFMLVDRHLESVSHRHIFGSGDIAALQSVRIPKSGVFAVRKGPVLAHNLRCALAGGRLRPFITTPSALGLISTGDRCAVMSWGSAALAGHWVWRWKDYIDRRFMAKYRIAPETGAAGRR